jgi:hypothetical protein
MILLVAATAGCSPPDDRLAELGRESCQRQAEQNRIIARQTEQATQTTGQLLEADARARQEMVQLQREMAEADATARQELLGIQEELVRRDADGREELNTLQRETHAAVAAQQETLDRHRQAVEDERRKLAEERHRAPIIAAAITQVGLVLACLAPLALCAYLLYVLRHTAADDDPAVTELLIEELAGDRPKLLAPRPTEEEEPLWLSGPEDAPDPGVDLLEPE